MQKKNMLSGKYNLRHNTAADRKYVFIQGDCNSVTLYFIHSVLLL